MNLIDSKQKNVRQNKEVYWKNLLSDFTEPTQLNISKKNLKKNAANKQIASKLSKLQTKQLKKLINENNLTLNDVVYCAWGFLLAKYSGSNDVVFGVSEIYAKIIPVRIKFTSAITVSKLLKKIAKQYKASREFVADIPKDKKLFDSIIKFNSRASSKYSVVLEVKKLTETFSYEINYSSIYDDRIMRQMARHLKNVIIRFIDNPEEKVLNVSCMSDKELHKILYEWNNTAADYPKDKTVHQLFEEQVERTPNNIAVVFENEKLTYKELNQKSNQLAHYIRKTYVEKFGEKLVPDTLIAICVERSLEMIIGILGILKAGAAYVPLDPSYPKERLKFMLRDTKAKIILTQKHITKNNFFLRHNFRKTIHLDNDWLQIEKCSNKNPKCITKATDLAYVIYTSGSTGKPKGVLIQHFSVVNCLSSILKKTNLCVKDKFLAITTLSFDVSVLDYFLPLLAGSNVIIGSQKIQKNIVELKAFLEERNISVMQATPSVLFALTNVGWKGCSDFKILAVGETLSQSLADRLVRCGVLFNIYGPTENTIYSSLKEIKRNEFVNIGRPIANVKVYVLDKYLYPLSIGILGELFVGGVGLARGYLNRFRLTHKKFIKNHFSEDKASKLYRTGDLVRWLPSGELEFLGRIDNQVKIRGFRVELGEIEAVISKYIDVEKSVVSTFEENQQKYLIGYYVPKKNKIITSQMLKDYMQKKLPHYMIPSIFIRLNKIPLTSNGKIDRKSLPLPKKDDHIFENIYIAPSTKAEKLLAKIWCDILKLDRVGIDDDFFSKGGHSLNVTQAVFQINKQFNINLHVNTLFRFSTIRDLNKLISLKSKGVYTKKIKPSKGNRIFPLACAQEQIWLHQQLVDELPVYNEVFVITMLHAVNISILKESINGLVKRHEMLRVKIVTKNNIPMQSINCFEKVNLLVLDLCHLSWKAKEKRAIQFVTKEAIKNFDLAKDRLIRFLLIRLNREKYKLFIIVHHIIIDGISIFNIVFKELEMFYKSLINGQRPLLPSLPIKYKDFVMWERKLLLGKLESGDIEYWQGKLRDLPVLNLPTRGSNLVNTNFHGDREYTIFPHKLVNAVEELSKQNKTTFFITLLTVFKVLLSYYTGQDDIVVGTVVHGRNSFDLQGIIGNFLNTIILRSNFSPNYDFQQVTNVIEKTIVEAYEHQLLPFQKNVKIYNFQRHQNNKLPFQVAFIYEPYLSRSALGWHLNQTEIHTGTSKLDLMFELDKREEGLILRVEYNTELFDKMVIKMMMNHFKFLLQKVVKNSAISIKNLYPLTQPERQKILIDWNHNGKPYPKDKTIHGLFEEQVNKAPDNIAVIYKNKKLTYKELNQKVNQLAHYLRKFYLTKFNQELLSDTLIGICMGRGLEMIIGMLGILKAGGSYVPLDQTYPKRRLQYMLQDTKIKVILTLSHVLDKLSFLSDRKKRVICLDDDWRHISEFSNKNLKVINDSNDLAYVIYTSGSTGKPKGVLVEHKSIGRLVKNTNYIKINRSDHIAQAANTSFDAATLEIWGALLNGASLVCVDHESLITTSKFAEFLKRERITILWLTSTLFEKYALDDASIFKQLKYLLSGGGVLNPQAINKVLKCKLGRPQYFLNGYGPTENTTFTTTFYMNKIIKKGNSIPIGSFISNTIGYVLNKHLQPLPIKVPGELYIGGDGLARGYLNQPELTREKFIRNPFSKDKNSRLYKTGDLVRWLPDGNLEFIGRIDDQVKVRGFRIELGEVEAQLSKYDDISQAVVLAKKDDAGNNYLVGFLVPARKDEFEVRGVRGHLQKFLPDYMIPDQFVVLDKLPITPNGKVDKKALLEVKTSVASKKSAIPSNELEVNIAGVLKKLLQREVIDINRNFFEMGVHSFLIIQASNLLCAKLNMQIKPIDLFTYPTIKSLADFITQSNETGSSKTKPSLFDEALNRVKRKRQLVRKRKGAYGNA